MITKEKLKEYERFKGDADMYSRVHRSNTKAANFENFLEISRALQESRLTQRGLVSEEYEKLAIKYIAEHCDNEDTISYLNFIGTTTDI